MNNPDFSKDAALVECAKAIIDAHLGHRSSEWDKLSGYLQDQWLRGADAARTFFGSGYRLPEATEENAERLAREYTRILIGKPQDDPGWVKDATNYLRAMHAAFGAPGPDSPADPTLCRPGCDRKFGHLGPHSDEMQEEIIPRRVIFTALASNPHLLKRLMDIDVRHARVRMIHEWAETFEEAACKK